MFVHIVEACIRINWKPVNSDRAIRQNSCYQGNNQQEGSTCKRKDNVHFLITSFIKALKVIKLYSEQVLFVILAFSTLENAAVAQWQSIQLACGRSGFDHRSLLKASSVSSTSKQKLSQSLYLKYNRIEVNLFFKNVLPL